MEWRMNKKKGTLGEEVAEAFLRSLDYRILARNFHSSRGEIDIVAGHGESIIFVEVKTWDGYPAHALEHSVGRQKQNRIMATARYFLSQNPHLQDSHIRFDVILLSGNMNKVNHIQNAFGA